MNTRRVITIFFAFALALSAAALWGAEGDEREGDAATNVVASSGAEAGAGAPAPKKKGGLFGKIFKAPLKAVGRLFGKGDDAGRVARMSERDAARFESAGVLRVEDRDNAAPDASDRGGSARDYLERGRQMLEAGRLNEAVAELSRAVSLDPKLGQAHNLLAVAYDRKGLHDRAQDSYKRAADAGGDGDAQALNNLGYSLYLAGNYRAAVDRLKRAARLAPADARILNNLALAQVRLGKYDDAYKNFARAGGEFSAHTNVAALLVRVGREERAVEHLEAARRLRPDSQNVLRQLAELYGHSGRADRAAEARQALAAADARQAEAAAEER